MDERHAALRDEALLCAKLSLETTDKAAQAEKQEREVVREQLDRAARNERRQEADIQATATAEIDQLRRILDAQERAASADRAKFHPRATVYAGAGRRSFSSAV